MRMAMVVAAVMLASGCEKPKGHIPGAAELNKPQPLARPAAPNPTPLPAERPPVALGVRAERIASDYAANELAADIKYKAKIVRVNGFVAEVSKFMGQPLISLRGAGIERVRCYFPKDLDTAHLSEMATLKKGDLMNLDGKVRGAGPMGGVVLDECFWPGNARVQRETPELLRR